MSALSCSDCGTDLKPNPRRTGTRCRSCIAIFIATDPEIRARARAGIRAAMKDKDMLRRRGRKISAARKLRMQTDPDFAAREIEKARKMGLSHTGMQRHGSGSEPRQRAAKTLSRTKRRGIPNGYWDEYQRVRKNYGAPAAEARRIVSEQAERDRNERKRLAAMSEDDRTREASRGLGAACARLVAREARR